MVMVLEVVLVVLEAVLHLLLLQLLLLQPRVLLKLSSPPGGRHRYQTKTPGSYSIISEHSVGTKCPQTKWF